MSVKQVIEDAESKMQKSVEMLKSKFKGIRTGRATPGLVEDIRVDYYGSPTPISQIANIGVPEPRMLVIRPYEQNMLSEIEKGIQKSGIGIHPNNDGKIIRLEIPPLDEERRNQLVKQLKELLEQSKSAVNSARRDANKILEQETKDGNISEDDRDRLKKDVDKLKDDFHKTLENLLEVKVKEIKTI